MKDTKGQNKNSEQKLAKIIASDFIVCYDSSVFQMYCWCSYGYIAPIRCKGQHPSYTRMSLNPGSHKPVISYRHVTSAVQTMKSLKKNKN